MKTRLDETNKMRRLMGLSLLNEQTISGGTPSKLDQQIGLSQKEGEELENVLVSVMDRVNDLKDEKKLNKEKLRTLLKQLRSNKITARMLRREKNKVDKLQREIDKLENTTPASRKAEIKKIVRDIGIILTGGLAALFMKDNPMIKSLIQKIDKATDLPRLH